jgi:hypothetical protein
MGVDFTVTFDHRLTAADLSALPERLNAAWRLPEMLAPWVSRHVRGGGTRWDWQLTAPHTSVSDALRVEGELSLDGPDGFHGRVLTHAIHVGHLARWWSFLYEPAMQAGLRLASRTLASTVGGEHILYLPDNRFPPADGVDALYEGGTVLDAIRWLHAHVHAPAPDPAAFLGREDDWQEGYDERTWFYERLSG